MSFPKSFVFCVAGLGFALAGCHDSSMSQAEVDASKHAPPMTDADRAKMAAGMAEGGRKAKAEQAAWADKNPTEVALINAERAKMGRPPLGGTP